jgi:hypothetical protein
MGREDGTRTGLTHEFLGQSETAVRAHYGERSNVSVLDAVGGFFFHFGKHVADDLGRVVGGFGGARDL